MKDKNIFAIIACMAILLLSSCSPDNNVEKSNVTINVMGRATSTENTLSLSSLDKYLVNGVDVLPEMKAQEGTKAGDRNAVFTTVIPYVDKVNVKPVVKEGFIFSNWEILDTEMDSSFHKELEDWLYADSRMRKAELNGIPSRYLEYIAPEFDPFLRVDISNDEAIENAKEAIKDMEEIYIYFYNSTPSAAHIEKINNMMQKPGGGDNPVTVFSAIKELKLDMTGLFFDPENQAPTFGFVLGPSIEEIAIIGLNYDNCDFDLKRPDRTIPMTMEIVNSYLKALDLQDIDFSEVYDCKAASFGTYATDITSLNVIARNSTFSEIIFNDVDSTAGSSILLDNISCQGEFNMKFRADIPLDVEFRKQAPDVIYYLDFDGNDGFISKDETKSISDNWTFRFTDGAEKPLEIPNLE